MLAQTVTVMLLASCFALGGVHAEERELGGSFFDDFDRLDPERWFASDGWSNGNHQSCGWSKNEIAVAGGVLQVGFSRNPAANRLYRCGELQSHARFSYGTYEARLKTPSEAPGLNAAFFTYGGPPIGEVHDEIDFEILLKDPARVQAGGYVGGKGVELATPLLPQPADKAFIDYAFVWEPGRVRYYVNGAPVHELGEPAPTPEHQQKLYFSLWSTETLSDWMGKFQDPGAPLTMEVDWVGYTAPGERCLFPQSITC
ncbi:family 16 glycosylhydrolase [Devosia sp. 919]|uniref:family 16 glycosylhydrolase n=1 Tax=Devosia sp. 919 TaxID=2726065 RepID=UPI0015570CD8|nr:family 16 glycosylhydrolase [Devosia sp. 919]